ncbi:hypothetical protein JTB14_001449 [Gonioctena quinquepunctata]|nr:hypothetical protein JTB14_001449 [Gonioctena quinquepunctata]
MHSHFHAQIVLLFIHTLVKLYIRSPMEQEIEMRNEPHFRHVPRPFVKRNRAFPIEPISKRHSYRPMNTRLPHAIAQATDNLDLESCEGSDES